MWQDGAWVHDPKLKVAEGRASAFPKTIVFYGHTGPQHRFMGTYEMDPDRVVRSLRGGGCVFFLSFDARL